MTDHNPSSSSSSLPMMIIISEQKHLERLMTQYYEWMMYNNNNNIVELSTKYQNVYNVLVEEFPELRIQEHQNQVEQIQHSIENTTAVTTISERSNNNTTTKIRNDKVLTNRKKTISTKTLETYPELYRRFMGISDNRCQQCLLRQQELVQKQLQQKQQHHKETRNAKKKKLVLTLENKFPVTFEKRYEILKKYYNYYGHCDVKIPNDDDDDTDIDIDEYDIQVKLCTWIMSLRQTYQRIINRPNSMPLTSIRSYDITPTRLQLLNDINFDFKAQYNDESYHYELYQPKQKDTEKKLQNQGVKNNNNKNNITHNNNKITTTTSSIMNKRSTTNSNRTSSTASLLLNREIDNTISDASKKRTSTIHDNTFRNDICKWNASNEVKEIFIQLLHKQQQSNHNIPFNVQALFRDAGQQHNIIVEHYNINTPNIIIGSYRSIHNAYKITRIPTEQITRIVRGEEDPHDDNYIMGWRYVLSSNTNTNNKNDTTTNYNNKNDDNKKRKRETTAQQQELGRGGVGRHENNNNNNNNKTLTSEIKSLCRHIDLTNIGIDETRKDSTKSIFDWERSNDENLHCLEKTCLIKTSSILRKKKSATEILNNENLKDLQIHNSIKSKYTTYNITPKNKIRSQQDTIRNNYWESDMKSWSATTTSSSEKKNSKRKNDDDEIQPLDHAKDLQGRHKETKTSPEHINRERDQSKLQNNQVLSTVRCDQKFRNDNFITTEPKDGYREVFNHGGKGSSLNPPALKIKKKKDHNSKHHTVDPAAKKPSQIINLCADEETDDGSHKDDSINQNMKTINENRQPLHISYDRQQSDDNGKNASHERELDTVYTEASSDTSLDKQEMNNRSKIVKHNRDNINKRKLEANPDDKSSETLEIPFNYSDGKSKTSRTLSTFEKTETDDNFSEKNATSDSLTSSKPKPTSNAIVIGNSFRVSEVNCERNEVIPRTKQYTGESTFRADSSSLTEKTVEKKNEVPKQRERRTCSGVGSTHDGIGGFLLLNEHTSSSQTTSFQRSSGHEVYSRRNSAADYNLSHHQIKKRSQDTR